MQTINFFRPSFEKNRCSMKRLKLRFLILFFSGNLQRVSRCFFAARIPKCLLTMICFSLLFRMGVKKKNTQSLNKYLHFNRPSSFQSQSQYYLSKKKKKEESYTVLTQFTSSPINTYLLFVLNHSQSKNESFLSKNSTICYIVTEQIYKSFRIHSSRSVISLVRNVTVVIYFVYFDGIFHCCNVANMSVHSIVRMASNGQMFHDRSNILSLESKSFSHSYRIYDVKEKLFCNP